MLLSSHKPAISLVGYHLKLNPLSRKRSTPKSNNYILVASEQVRVSVINAARPLIHLVR